MQSEHKVIINSIKPALLSESEIQWLRGDKKVSKTFEYKMRSSIKRKVQSLTQLELPLLIRNNFLMVRL
jgi:hypothetical protein